MTKYQLMVVAARVPESAEIIAISDCEEQRTAEVQIRFDGCVVLRRYSYDARGLVEEQLTPPRTVTEECNALVEEIEEATAKLQRKKNA